MLTIYTKTKPKGLILSVDGYFNAFSYIPDTTLSREVLVNIEKGSYLNSRSFISRSGDVLSKNDLSTGVKALFNLLQHPDTPLNMQELGSNLGYYLCSVENGIIYLPQVVFEELDLDKKVDVYAVDFDKKYTSVAEYIADVYEVIKGEEII